MLDITRLFFRQTCTNNDDEDNQNMALTQIVGVIDASSRLNSQSTFVIDFASHALKAFIIYRRGFFGRLSKGMCKSLLGING